MTRIFDDPAAFADEALDGFVAVHRGYVARVDGGVVRSTVSLEGRVALIVGGGSGHYPAFAGLVGPGLAAGAACGNVFASPAASQIYRVAKAAHTGGGVLLSYGNYAGDVLNFGQAEQRLNSEGIPTRTVLVTDDIASAPATQWQKRRGIAGDLAVFKIAGAAAEAGLELDEVERVAGKANDRIRSLGVAFDGCTLPGADGPLFHVPEQGMSLGLGIHGEPGISDHPMSTASELAQLLVSRLLEEKPEGAGARVIPILNGLGTIKYEELFLLYGKIARLLLAAGLEIVEPECGELVTSLDMSGLSLTLFWPDDELARLWAAPADSPAYRKGVMPVRQHRTVTVGEPQRQHSGEQMATEASRELGAIVAVALDAVRGELASNERLLGDLDSVAGDGDHGSGMRRGAEAAVAAARNAVETDRGVHEVLAQAGEAWSDRAGGTSGALWGAALVAMGQTLADREGYGRQDALNAAGAFRDSILGLGRAEPGDKTMVDALLPFTESFARAVGAGASLQESLSLAAEQARLAAAHTAAMSPKKGRARPLAERSLGHPDPGAVSFGLIVLAVARYAEQAATYNKDEEHG